MYVQPEENRETRIGKKEKVKNNRFKDELKMTFLFNFEILRLKRLGKTVEQAVIPGNFKRRYRRYNSGVLVY